MKQMICRLGYSSSILPPCSGDGSGSAFMCRPCYSQVERALKLKVDLSKVEDAIAEKLHLCAANIGEIPSTSQSGKMAVKGHSYIRLLFNCHTKGYALTPVKRPSTGGTPPVKRIRQRITTPVRQVLQQTIVQESPAVSTSRSALNIYIQ